MPEWKEIRFEEIFKIPLKNGLTKPSKVRGDGLRMVNMKEIFGYDFIDDSTPMELVPVTRDEVSFSLEHNDLLFARQSLVEAGAGKIAIYKGHGETVFESHLIRCRIDNTLALPDFVYYLFKSPVGKKTVSTIVEQVAAAGIRGSDLKNLRFTIPQLPEQIQIARILSSLDDKIDLLERQNKTLEQLAKTLFRQWFVEEAEENWETKKIIDVAEINSKTISKNYPFKEIEYLDTGSITEGIIEGFQNLKLTDAPSRAQRIINDNDIVYSVVRPIQRHYGLLNDLKPNAVASTGFCVLTATHVSPHFIYLMLTSDESVEYFDVLAEASTSTYPSLKPSDIANFEFRMPPLEKLESFSKYATNAWNKIKSNTNQIRTLTQLRDTLLPKLMSGEVRIL